jgi:hypothetical protein
MIFLLVMLGTFISMFERFATAQQKKDFNIRIFFEKNWSIFVLNFLTSLGLYFALFYNEVLPAYKPFLDFDIMNLFIITTGAVSLYVWKGLISLYKMIFKRKMNGYKGK